MLKNDATQIRASRLIRNVIVSFLVVLFILTAVVTLQDIPSIRATFTIPDISPRLSSLTVDSPIFHTTDPITEHDVPWDPDDPLDQSLHTIRDANNWRLLGGVDTTGEEIYHDRSTGRFFKNEATVAFFLQLAESNLLLAPRLLSRVWHPGNVYAIHFDTKIPPNMTHRFVAALKSNRHLTNVLVLPSVPVTYTGISELLNTLDCMHTLLNISKTWDYFINLSGSDYPLVSPTALRRLLGAPGLRGSARSFIGFAPRSIWLWAEEKRLGKVSFDPALSFQYDIREDVIKRRIPHDVARGNLAITIGRGPAWIVAHRSFCEYAVHGNAARRVLTLFANMQGSPEHFFQTIAWNHPRFNKSIIFSSLRDVMFTFNGKPSGQHPFYRDGKDKKGKWEMWPILAYSTQLFARKFQHPNSRLLEHIDTQKSAAATSFANMTAVEESFALVKKYFSCLLDYDTAKVTDKLHYCREGGRYMKGCNGNPDELCTSGFAPPPE